MFSNGLSFPDVKFRGLKFQGLNFRGLKFRNTPLLSRVKLRIFSPSKPFFEVVCNNDLLTIKNLSTLWKKDLENTFFVFSQKKTVLN